MAGEDRSTSDDGMREWLQRKIDQRVRLYPSPPPGFDATRASPDQLVTYGLPQRPDAVLNRRLHDFWMKMFKPPLRFIRPELQGKAQLRHLLREGSPGAGSKALAFCPSRWGTSRNWSGAVITARDSMLFRTVAGSWKVPKPKPPAGASAMQPPPGNAWQCSVWVGFDGFHRWSVSLPQMGTVSEVDIKGNVLQPGTYAFCQWWVRGQSYGEVRIANMPIEPKDKIFCMLTAQGPTDVHFAMTNRTKKHSVSLSWAAGEVEQDPAKLDRSEAPLEGRTAVWCVERPLTMPVGTEAPMLYRLPKIGKVRFKEALAEMRDPANPATPPVPRDLTAARLLRMVGSAKDNAPPRSIALTSPAAPATGGSSLTIRQEPYPPDAVP